MLHTGTTCNTFLAPEVALWEVTRARRLCDYSRRAEGRTRNANADNKRTYCEINDVTLFPAS
jgi:hypothetical protein